MSIFNDLVTNIFHILAGAMYVPMSYPKPAQDSY